MPACSASTTEGTQPTISRDAPATAYSDVDAFVSCEDARAGRADLRGMDIGVFIRADLGDKPLTTLSEQIEGFDSVVGVQQVTQADSFVEFKQMFADSPNVLEGITVLDLPAVVEIDVEDASAIPEVVAQVEGLPGVYRVLPDDCG